MKILISLFLWLFAVNQVFVPRALAGVQEAVKNVQVSQVAVTTPLVNADVVELVRTNTATESIIAKIKSSSCNFETTPEALQRLRADGVPDAIIFAMAVAPKADTTTRAPLTVAAEQPPPQSLRLKIPAGTMIDVETAYTVSSQDVRENDLISFRVINPVIIEGLMVIAVGATATARVVQANRGGHFGRAGRLAWTMQDVTAVDGTRVPVQFAGRVVGDSKGAKVATQIALTAAALPLLAPVALLHGFKRGENAFIPAGKRFAATVSSEAHVTTHPPH